MDHTRITQRRAVGRPSTVAAYETLLAQWLHSNPSLTGAEILRLARHSGYRGGKSALYELIRRMRPQ
jgi:hypothetical protein